MRTTARRHLEALLSRSGLSDGLPVFVRTSPRGTCASRSNSAGRDVLFGQKTPDLRRPIWHIESLVTSISCFNHRRFRFASYLYRAATGNSEIKTCYPCYDSAGITHTKESLLGRARRTDIRNWKRRALFLSLKLGSSTLMSIPTPPQTIGK